MKELDKIPVSKVGRASRFISAGAKVGGNYIKYYSKKMLNPELDRSSLDEDNAEDVYEALSELKGSALKVAQMLSMDQGLLPTAYADKFSQAQYSAPPLSYPLVVRTFMQQIGKTPSEIYSNFTPSAVKAASIGQVHKAEKDGLPVAIKVQYPGVANSIESDLRIVKPLAQQLFNIKPAEMEYYMSEVKTKLIEECDYELEVTRGIEISEACKHIDGIKFPKYYPEFSGPRIITMEWIEGKHLDEFLATNPTQEVLAKAAQSLWDFYNYQIHELRQVHADPHPGNFIFQPDGSVYVIDFGCVKEIPEAFYNQYFQLLNGDLVFDKTEFNRLLRELKFLLASDKPDEVVYFTQVFFQIIELLGRPFRTDQFDFGDATYFAKIYELGEMYSKDKKLKSANGARGPKDALYINRTYFGLYSILSKLGQEVATTTHLRVGV